MPKSEKALVTHSGTLAWKIPWMEEPGRLQSMGLLRVGHDWAASLSLFTFEHWRRKWQPTPEEPGCHLWGHTELDRTEATVAAAACPSMRPEWLLYYENVSLLRELGSKPYSTSCGSSEPCRDIWELQAASFPAITSGSCLCFWAAISVLYCFNPNGKCRPLISTKNLCNTPAPL